MPLAPHRTRRLLLRALFPLLSGAALAACADDRPPPRTSFPALRYGFLTPLRLNVASVEIRDEAPQAPAPLLPPAVQASAVPAAAGGGPAGGQRLVPGRPCS